MDDKNRSRDSGGTQQGSSAIREQHDWSTKDPQKFLSGFRDVISHARDAGVTEQQLLDTISQNYQSGSGTGSGGTGSSGSNR